MSDKVTDTTILSAVQNEKVGQESAQSSNEESGGQVLESCTESQQGGESLGTESQQDSATGGPDSEQSSATGGPDSEQSSATDGPGSEQGGATGGPESEQSSATDGPGSEQGGATGGPGSEQGGATGGPGSEQGGASLGTESRQGGATGGPGSEQGGATGGVSRQQSKESALSVGTNADSVATGDSQETAVVGDLSDQNSFESAVGGDISNSPQESLPNTSESWEGMARPSQPSATGQETEDSPRQRFRCCFLVCNYLRPYSMRILESYTYRSIRAFLFFTAFLVAGMGLGHLYDCPVKIELPVYVFFLGIIGALLLFCNLAMDNRSFDHPNIRTYLFRAVMVLSRLTFLGLFGAVLYSTYSISPSFEDDGNFCSKAFYYFVYFGNFIIGGIVVAAFFIYIPALCEEVPYERI